MTKQELLDYLCAACDVENAIFTCEEVITTLDSSKGEIPHPIAPSQPARVYNPPQTKSSSDGMEYMVPGSIIGAIIGLIIGIKLGGWIILFGLVGGFFVGLWGGLFIGEKIEDSRRSEQIRLANAAADRKYNADMETYTSQCENYQKALQIESNAVAAIDSGIADLRSRIRELDILRKSLYEAGILHPTFQNMLAVNQIREYMEMGVCVELEGPNGAYALYLQDIRANRICDSIDELRKSVDSGFAQVAASHSLLLQELRTTKAHISAMHSSLDMGLVNIQRLIQGNRASLLQASNHLEKINATLKDAAHNEYIAMKAAKVEGYLNLRHIG